MADETKSNGGADVAVDAFGVKANIRNVKSLNTVFTVLGFVITSMVAGLLWLHKDEERDARKAVAEAMLELARAQREAIAVGREQNCLISFQQDQRSLQRDFCRQVSGASK